MVISDSIADAGNRYHLEMRALDCGSGVTLAEEGTDISGRPEVPDVTCHFMTRLMT